MPRPKGRKNNATLLREASIARALKLAEGALVADLPAIVNAVVTKAKQGDLRAAELVFSRVLPVRKAVDDLASGKSAIQINIVSANPEPQEVSINAICEKSSEANLEPAITAHGQNPEVEESGEELAEHAGEEGQQPHPNPARSRLN